MGDAVEYPLFLSASSSKCRGIWFKADLLPACLLAQIQTRALANCSCIHSQSSFRPRFVRVYPAVCVESNQQFGLFVRPNYATIELIGECAMTMSARSIVEANAQRGTNGELNLWA
jgi:hypothetical protein